MLRNPTSAGEVQSKPYERRWLALGLLGTAQLMLILDVTVVSIALPHIGADLGVGREVLTWVVSGYALAFGSLMLLGGRAADIWGPKRVVLAGLVLFTGASLVAGLADNGSALLGGRVAQGVGAALLSPAALSAVVRLFDGQERNKALGVWSALGGGGAALGVLLGGLLTAGPGWPWVFFANVPIGIVLLSSLVRVLPALPESGAPEARLDIVGAVLVAVATGTGIYALIRAGEQGWFTLETLGRLGVALLLYAVFGVWQRLTATPLLDLGLLRRRPVVAGVSTLAVATALMVAVFFLGSFYLQAYAGHGPLTTGLLFLPVALATMATANAAGRVIGALGGRRLTVLGLGVAAMGFVLPVLWPGTVAIVVGISVAGAGLGMMFVVASATALGHVAPHEAGIASGILSTFHEFGAAAGAAVVSSIAAASLLVGTASGFEDAFLVAALGAAVAAAALAPLVPPPRTGVTAAEALR
jgi:EmrB/QacA subfamily drug resistance transporter